MIDDPMTRIDEVLHDYTVSADAMRSRPAIAGLLPPDDSIVATGGLIWIAPAGTDPRGEGWQRLDGIASVEFGEDVATVEISPHAEALVRTLRRASGAARVVAQQAPEQLGVRLPMTDDEIDALQRDFQAFIERYAAAYRRAAGAVTARQVREGFRDGGWIDTNGDPVEPPVRPSPPLSHRDGRPAWQTPYGPVRRRR